MMSKYRRYGLRGIQRHIKRLMEVYARNDFIMQATCTITALIKF